MLAGPRLPPLGPPPLPPADPWSPRMEVERVPTLPPPPPLLPRSPPPEPPEDPKRLVEERTDSEPLRLPPPPVSDSAPPEPPPPAELPPEELEDEEKAEEPPAPEDRRAALGTETVVERAMLDSPAPCRAPRICGATSAAKFCAAVEPVSRMVRSRLPRNTLAVRTWAGAPPAAPAAGRGACRRASK